MICLFSSPDLMRSHFAFFVIAMLMLVIGVIIGMFGCWGGKPDAVRLSGLFVFIAGMRNVHI